MNIVLSILGGVLLFLLLLLLLLFILSLFPVSLRVAYREEKLTVTGHYLFLSIPLVPGKEEEKPDEEEEEKEPEEKKPKEKKPIKEQLAQWKELGAKGLELLKTSKRALTTVKNHLIFYKIQIFALVGGEDAHQIGEEYGAHSAIIGSAMGLLYQFFHVKEPIIWLQPDFLATKSEYDISFRVKIKPIFALVAGLGLLTKIVKLRGKEDSSQPPPPSQPTDKKQENSTSKQHDIKGGKKL